MDTMQSLAEKLMTEVEEVEKWEGVQKLIHKTLPNDSDETDYEQWGKGFDKFAKDNKPIVEAWLKK